VTFFRDIISQRYHLSEISSLRDILHLKRKTSKQITKVIVIALNFTLVLPSYIKCSEWKIAIYMVILEILKSLQNYAKWAELSFNHYFLG